MFDIKIIRENPDIVRENMKKKFQHAKLNLVDEAAEKDVEWRKIKKDIDDFRHTRNDLSQKINETKKAGEDIRGLLLEVKEIPIKIKALEESSNALLLEINDILARIPNMMDPSVPIGEDDDQNVELYKWGEETRPDFKVKNHVELAEDLGIADFEAATNLSGSGFYLLKGDLALLNQALIRYTIEFMQERDYTYVEVPLLIKKKMLDAAMDTVAFTETIYSVKDKDLHMIGTSEHALLGIHANGAIKEEDLPKKYFSYSMCFRQEIGSHGINEKGLWRTHQFNKIEQFVFCDPKESFRYYDELQKNSEDLFQSLGLSYRVVECCSGDLAAWKAKSADIEVWRPTTQGYGEVTSLTNATDYQARSLNIKVLRKNNEREVLHTLNNTALATSRVLVAILENYQNADGSVTVPEVLRPFMFGKEKIEKA